MELLQLGIVNIMMKKEMSETQVLALLVLTPPK